ncbi:MAG: hypothetical protein JJT90_08885 [Ectothiorhodospiraceae bacterium]|nr:hypothetical protein [Ectothiorhodospiraceae bacterium]
MSKEQKPMTVAEARAYEAPIRRQMWIGIGAGALVIILLIVFVMEARFRSALTDPRPSMALDTTVQNVLTDMRPLPADIRRILVDTHELRDGVQVYAVRLHDADARLVYDLTRRADTLLLIPYGPREGTAVNFEVDLVLSEYGEVRGQYRQDRGVDVHTYEAVLASLVRQALAALHAQAGFPVPEHRGEAPDRQRIRQGWEATMD